MPPKLILILGCMFSGKSSKLLEYYNKYSLKYKCLLISYKKDTRYGNSVVATHDKLSVKSHPVLELTDMFETEDYTTSNVILIDEGQFFNDLVSFVKRAIDFDNKIVIVSGLNGDYDKKPIGQINELIVEADDIYFQKAICHYCKSPVDAIFSLRINTTNQEQILIGEKDTYVPVCRYHYKRNKN